MRAYVMEAGLALVAMALCVTAVRRAGGDELMQAPVPVPPAAARQTAHMTDAALERARENVIQRNPFRVNRSPGLSRTGHAPAAGSVAPLPLVATPTRPALIVRAIVGGPPWNAVLDGLPNGTAATVVREGDVFGDVRIGAITRDTLVAAVRDSVWKYGVHRDSE